MRCMELFVEQKNKNYGAVYDLLMEIQRKPNKTITSNEISKLILERGLYTPYFEKSLMNKCKEKKDNLYILKEVSKGIYTIDTETVFPPPILDIEMIYLKSILNDERVSIFLDKSTIDKLKITLGEYEDFQMEEDIVVEGVGKNIHDYERLNKIMLLFIQSKEERRLIKYTYKAKNGQIFNDKYMVPYKIEYSIRDDIFYLIYYSVETRRMIKGIISNFTDLELYDNYEDYDFVLKNIFYFLDKQKMKEPVVIEVKNRKNAVERAFYLFSCFEKQAYYDRERDIHVISLYYYEYDEAEIISRILSLGKNAVVVSPKGIREQIIQRIKKSIKLYT